MRINKPTLVEQKNIFLLSNHVSHFITPQIYLLTPCGGPDPQVGNIMFFPHTHFLCDKGCMYS